MVEQLDAACTGQLLEELDAFGVVLCADSGVVGEVGELRLVLVELIAGCIERIVRLLPAHVLDHCGFFLPGEVPLSHPGSRIAVDVLIRALAAGWWDEIEERPGRRVRS